MSRAAKFSSPGVTIALALIAVVVLGGYGLLAFRAIPPQPNIFAEIYADTEKNYHRYPTILEIQSVSQRGAGFYSDEPLSSTYYFNKSTDDLRKYEIIGHFYLNDDKFTILARIKKKNGVSISISAEYLARDRVLTREVGVWVDNDTYITDDNPERKAQVLRDAGITREDLESYYRAVVDDYILSDWVKVYGSEFSPTDYGEVTIVDEWDRYFEQDS